MAEYQQLRDDMTRQRISPPFWRWPHPRQAVSVHAYQAAEADFLRRYPAYAATSAIDAIRAHEYGRLDRLAQVYLDYTGGSLYAEAQLQEHMALLADQVFGNPHSSNPTSLAMTTLVEQTRAVVLDYLNASPDEYAVIFTSNASGALKLVGEAYPFAPNGHYLLTCDNHNSVNGIREFARARGAAYTYIPLVPGDLRLDEAELEAQLDRPGGAHRLFTYPAQSNFSGVQHALEWIERAQAKGWDVLLDAAAFVPTNRLDLSRWRPDFVALSFYKMFGYPTGSGALIARRAALQKLRRPWFAGGTIALASVQGDGHYLAEGPAAFEDGTVNYLNAPAVAYGLRQLATIGIDAIHTRVECLTGWLLDSLTALRHSNGTPLVAVYGPAGTWMRGGCVSINFRDPAGQLIDYRLIEQQANAMNISLRTGCFCNPGASEIAHGYAKDELEALFRSATPPTPEQFRQAIGPRASGAVRVSLGLVSNFADVFTFLQFARGYLEQSANDLGARSAGVGSAQPPIA
jgi:selenocysteine lyase/cysteine desulfurase